MSLVTRSKRYPLWAAFGAALMLVATVAVHAAAPPPTIRDFTKTYAITFVAITLLFVLAWFYWLVKLKCDT